MADGSRIRNPGMYEPRRLTMKITKRAGYHILAFIIGAVAPLPLLIGFQQRSDQDSHRERIPENTRQLRLDGEVELPANDSSDPPSKPQDGEQDFTHNTISRYAEDVSLFLDGRQSVADPGS